ncbi:tetratricopeptide repeat protein [Fibrobacter sp. UWH1]|uniref:tetratricopeptide repeat protein n=1 Tax=Fibrobacter sp. UWH1 TaxID=1964354 RepID=UPI000B51F45A|nr:tetratricopeptide repeat protein [Fibrobacter sp. UWH1]MCQ2099626.1 tetratricopeptide repeat protein [Fibrobacter sp.]OWV15616.1 hypothetical protein B7992_04325 [Fibrobacter sp. UWH1]
MISFKTKKFVLAAALATALGVAGCNLFNPTEDANIRSGDADAMTYEGYIKFRNNEYTLAADYFNQAIAADSTHSEAWYGLAKAKLNIQDLNTFELLKYVNISGGAERLALLDMEQSVVDKYEAGIDTVVTLLKEFIARDTTGRLDGKITYRTISESYMLLNMLQTLFVLRDATKLVVGCGMVDPNTGKYSCDVGAVLNTLKRNKDGESTAALHEVFSTCESNPETMSSVAGQAIPVFDEWLTDNSQTQVASTMCGVLADITEPSEDADAIDMSVNSIIAVTGKSTIMDDDGDGCYDEEIMDGMDNDGDGEVDEDLRDVNAEFSLDLATQTKNIAAGKTQTKDRVVYSSFGPNEKYMNVDIDRDGKLCTEENCGEWEYIYPSYAKRESNGQNYLLKFAKKIKFNPMGLPPEEFKALKKRVAQDYSGRIYNLKARQDSVGGCWVNYTEEQFRIWVNEWENF